MKYEHIYKEVEAEIERSEAKHGNQDHVPSLDQTLLNRDNSCSPERMADEYEVPTADRAQYLCDIRMKQGNHTHAHIVIEELCEAIDCLADEDAIRKELIQLACVVIKWIKSVDYRRNGISVKTDSRKEAVLRTIDDISSNFLYYDRKESESLSMEDLNGVVKDGSITIDEMVARFRINLENTFATKGTAS